MKIGDYVRFKDGDIGRIMDIEEHKIEEHKRVRKLIRVEDFSYLYFKEGDIEKSSPNIIDLIEVGDYVNGEKVTRVIPEDICGDEVLDYQHIFVGDKEIFKEDIKSIVTKEQFESMEYKVVK